MNSKQMNNNLVQQWRKGPTKDHSLEPGHGRGIFCLDIRDNHLVTGSADHGLRCYNLSSMKYEKELFSKRYGHHEWVTSVAHLPNGRIISAGMDSALCYWDAKGVRCDTLLGHQGSVTKVLTDDNLIAISASYDATLIIWNLGSLEEARKLYGPHKDAILDFDWNNSLAVSGDKNGTVAFWDINEGVPVFTKKVHQGGCGQVKLHSDGGSNNLVITGGINDGVLSVHDMRTGKSVFTGQIHKGAINSIKVNLQNFSNIQQRLLVVTGSADKTVKLTDIVSGFKPVCQMKATDAVFSVDTIYNVTVAGSGDGNVLVYDNDSGQCLYAFGAMTKGGVRCMQITPDQNKLVVCGDDFSPMVLVFN